jgi:FkbM family methyltransferase
MNPFGRQKNFHSIFRKISWRIGRKIYTWSRHDQINRPEVNGEYALLKSFLKKKSGGILLFDIGANKGEWSIKALEVSKQLGVNIQIHLFEPAADSFTRLKKIMLDTHVHLNKVALSNQKGITNLFVRGEICGINSLYGDGGGNPEEVESITFDDYLAKLGVTEMVIVKSDTEGHDFKVIQGATCALKLGKVAVWQFEYNHRWIEARNYLKDVFEFILDKPYWVGKLSSNGVEIYREWHPELERFFEGNYVLMRKDLAGDKNYCEMSVFNYSNVPAKVV